MNILLLSLLFFIFAIFTMKYKEKKRKRIFLDVGLFVLFGILTIIYFVASYFTGNGINETVLAALNLGLGEAGFEEYILLILASIASFVILFVAAFFYYRHLDTVVAAKPQKIKAFLHNGFLILAFLAHPSTIDLKNLYQSLTLEQADDFYEYYKIPTTSDLNSSKKNIIFLYGESLERTYFDNELFENLTPNLTQIIKENGIEFTNIVQTSGSNYTIAGITSTQCGIPLFTTSSGNSMEGVDKFYPKATCIGDVLKKDDYFLSFMQGSSTKFSGIDKFYKTHSFDKVQGREELQKKLQNKRYVNGWGLYDDSLLEMVYKEFETLSSSNKHFALFTHTLDTHHPKGHLSNSCSKDLYLDGSNEILNTVKCSDILISKFIKKVQNSKYGANTIIVLTSDHLAMRNTAIDQINESKNRRNLFVVLDPNNKEYKAVDKMGTPFDFSPTALSFLDIKTDLGLGRNLRENESVYTLFGNFDKKLNQWRNYILSFWQFPKMSDTLSIDFKKMLVNLESSSYKLPVLFRVLDNNVEPYFQFNYAWKLYEQLENFKQNDKFLWVDRCDVMNYIFSTNESGKQCIAEGILGVKYKVKGVDKIKDYKIDGYEDNLSLNSSLEKIISNIDMLKRNGIEYKASLKDAILFKKEGYPSFLKNIEGVSYPDKLGRWTDAELHPSAIFTFKEPLASKFKLEIVCRAYGENINENRVKIKVGNNIHEFTPQYKSPSKYTFEFDNLEYANTIEIVPPKPFENKEELEGSDTRKFGLFLVSLKIIGMENR